MMTAGSSRATGSSSGGGSRPVGGDHVGGGGELGGVHEHRRAAVCGDEGELGRREPPVERHEHPTERSAGEQRLEQGRIVGAEVRDPVATPHAQVSEGAGETPAPIVELGVGARRVAAAQCDLVGGEAPPAGGPRAESLVAHGAIVTTIARKVNGAGAVRQIVDNRVHIEQTATSWPTVSGPW